MYHKIFPENDSTDLTVKTKNFSIQMHYLKKAGYNTITLFQLIEYLNGNFKLPEKPVIITFDDAFSCIIKYAKPILDELDFKAVVFVVVNAIGKKNFWDYGKNVPETKCMDKGELKYLVMSGWEIGSHGLFHKDLTNLSKKELAKEIKKSKEKLENLLKIKITTFCYPYGKYNDEVIKEIKNSDYLCACAVESKNKSVTENPFILRRIYIKSKDSLFTFKRKISNWYLFYRGLRKR